MDLVGRHCKRRALNGCPLRVHKADEPSGIVKNGAAAVARIMVNTDLQKFRRDGPVFQGARAEAVDPSS